MAKERAPIAATSTGIPCCADKFASCVHQAQHFVDGKYWPYFVGCIDQHVLSARRRNTGSECWHQSACDIVVHTAKVTIACAQVFDDRDASIVGIVIDNDHLIRNVDNGVEN